MQMNVHRFYDEGLAHASYAIISRNQVALIDPGRNPKPYLDFAVNHHARISAIIETHPHADFVSSHVELYELNEAPIYTSSLAGVGYPYIPFDEGDRIPLGSIQLEAIHTPGHSPDSISILLLDEHAQPHAVFTGDTLFVGDVGRPDLRENVGNIRAEARALARQLYRTTREKLMKLPHDVRVYPAHGPGSLCGKNIGSELDSTIGREIRENYALQPMSEDEFVALVLDQLPFVPKYFAYDVMLNKQGADAFLASIEAIPILVGPHEMRPQVLIVDGRPAEQFRSGHMPGAINIPDGPRFETWLGSVVGPEETCYLLAADPVQLRKLLEKAAKIGYERLIAATLVVTDGPLKSAPFDPEHFASHQQAYTIVDIRNRQESNTQIVKNAIQIPLPELRERLQEIPTDKPIAVHCAGGYRSAIGSSILASALTDTIVQDISTHILDVDQAS
ncbi:Glyoxylase, beta-lactamase superfamily II [Parapedobacter indicus]|uniref:Glyoxylase, beta-lactamase superfamily II n=2 Tax=Parapedobacter indicus TaxID=1477437 RepID=A0A1I3QPF4_9SPHI|nr:glyoxylase-like metal-dependent hydrolase (beta-lactamase superfamily II) [Parapedobacter indicus]SFJ34997.1 Glyoxylase, beta-lactamase superfamily II [Parapedobacter indicus]